MIDSDGFLEWFRSAAPYFNAHRSRKLVAHFGGELVASARFAEFVHDLALLHSLGVRLVLVPGIRPQIEARLAARGLASRIAAGLRVTDADMVPSVRDAAAEVGLELQSRLSMGLANSPMQGARIRVASGNFVTARPLGVIDGIDYGYSGEVRRVDTDAIDSALEAGAIVVVPPLGFSPTGETFNLHAESVATAVAIELRAYKLMLLGDGITLTHGDGTRVGELSIGQASARLAELRSDAGAADDVRRLESAVHACRNGVRRVHLLDASRPGALPLEMFTRDGVGTMITADAYDDVRRATLEDAGGILELIEPLERDGVLVRRARRDIEATIGHYFVEQRDGAIVACAAAHPFLEESVVELACLAVREDYRDSGRGDLLLATVETEARRLGAERLIVLTTQATHWFLERGFAESDLDALPIGRRALYNYQRRSKVLVKAL